MIAKFVSIMVIILSLAIPLRCLAEDIAADLKKSDKISEHIKIFQVEKQFDKIFDEYNKNYVTNNYTFYINPLKWSLMTHKSKVMLYMKCVLYQMAKEEEEGNNAILAVSERKIKIRSSIDGTILVIYEPKMGKTLKFTDKTINALSENLLFTRLYLKFKPKNQADIILAYKHKALSRIEDNTYFYKPYSINRGFQIVINRTGEIEKLVLISAPWIDKVDDYASSIIKATAPFAPLPKEYKKDTITIVSNILVNKDDIE